MQSRRDHILDAAVRRSVAARTPPRPRLRRPAPEHSTDPAGPGSSPQDHTGQRRRRRWLPFLAWIAHRPGDALSLGVLVLVAASAVGLVLWRVWA